MRKHTVRLHPLGKEFQVNHNTSFVDILHEYGIEFPCGGKGTCGKCKIRVLDGTVEADDFQRQKLERLKLDDDWRLSCMSHCTGDVTLEVEQLEQLILADESTFEFQAQEGYGIAVDLGTTTLVTQLIDLSTARVIAVETALNPQAKFGADLISRIQACLDGHLEEMKRLIREAVGAMTGKMLQKYKLEPRKVVIVGNTVMQLIFSGCDISPLATYPFHTDDLGPKIFHPDELGWTFPVTENIIFYPSIGSFVGSDILAGIAATKLLEKEKYTALIDLGTNGEIVLGNREGILCASTAAGPAFEGSNISMGMRAVNGAISSLSLKDGNIETKVIGNTSPKGICGSALIDAIAILRQKELIGMFGEINSGEGSIQLAGNVFLSQKDINEFQLAKAAIAAGFEILAKKRSIKVSEIDEIYIAGGFGNYINVENLLSTGMINASPDNIHKMGNTALIGAKMFLFAEVEKSEQILFKTTHINLEGDPEFQDIFINNMMFL